jgi:hypothetical protein
VLVLEVVLTRVFAVTQFYHFAFLTVSLALLGFGASGSALSVFPALGRGGERKWAMLAAAQGVATLAGFGLTNWIPFDSFTIGWDRMQVLYLTAYYLVLAVPFFFGGLVVGTLLAGVDRANSVPSHRVYAASLAGSGAGSLLALGGLDRLDGVAMIAAAAALAGLAAMAFAFAAPAGSLPLRAACGALACGLIVLTAAPPAILDLRISPYKTLSTMTRLPGTEIVSTKWNARSRVDHLRSTSIRSVPGLSYAYRGELPAQDGLTFDGDDLSPVPAVDPSRAEFALFTLGSLAYSLTGGDALVLEPRGGLDILVALASGAATVTAVEPNPLAVAAARETPDNVYEDPRVRLVVAEPRSFVERSGDLYDVVVLALTAPYRPVTSGAYSLTEDYRLTVEAFTSYLERLAPGGIFTAMRWVQVPPSESVRLIALAAAAADRVGAEPAGSVVALRGYSTAVVLVKPDGFTAEDIAVVIDFAETRRFDLVAAPGLEAEDANRFNVLSDDEYFPLAASLLGGSPPSSYPFDITPPTDDHPFFGHYFTWAQASEVLDTLGKTWQPFGGAGYFVLLALLALVAGAALILILVPLWSSRRAPKPPGRGVRMWTVAYFGLLGIGFLAVEIPLIQRYMLLLGKPATAFAVVLFALLTSSGLGSLASRRVPWRLGASAAALLAALSPWSTSALTDAALSLPLAARVALGAAALYPLGFVMGTMFPRGIGHLEAVAPGMIPWAWGINGTLSVVSAVLAALMALSSGFTAVLLVGAGCYALCVPLTRRVTRG